MRTSVSKIGQVLILAVLPVLGGLCGLILSSGAGQAWGRPLSASEMSETFGAASYSDKCLGDVIGCEDLDDYWAYFAVCTAHFNDAVACGNAPAGVYNYGYANTKGCNVDLTPETYQVTCFEADQNTVCAWFAVCVYTDYSMGDFHWGTCSPQGTPGFWAPSTSIQWGNCTIFP